MESQSQDTIQTDSDSVYVLGLLAQLQSQGTTSFDSEPSRLPQMKWRAFKFATDEGIKTAAEVELVKAFVTDSNRLLYILVDIGDRC
jgi:hypothetical protein